MIVGDRLKAIREMKNLSQGDIQKRIGLLRCYISRVEKPRTAKRDSLLTYRDNLLTQYGP